MSDIFISYKKEDRDRARVIAEMFVANGFDVWWDIELLPGQNFADEINSVINTAKAAVVLWTPKSVQSDWVKAEATLAKNRNILVPVWLEKTDLPVPFNTLHTHDLTGWSGHVGDTRLSVLLEGVRSVAGKPNKEKLVRSKEEIEEILEKPSLETEYWNSVNNREQQSIEEYEAYISKFGGNGAFSDLASLRITNLKNSDKPARTTMQWAKISIFGIEVPISRSLATILITIVGIGMLWWNWADVCSKLGLCGEPLVPSHGTRHSAENNQAPESGSSARSNGNEFVVNVAASTEWHNSEINIESGDTVRLSATGSWTQDPLTPIFGPNGRKNGLENLCYLKTTNTGTLIGRIGGGDPFAIGDRREIVSSSDGKLSLAINDAPGEYYNNQGKMTVVVILN